MEEHIKRKYRLERHIKEFNEIRKKYLESSLKKHTPEYFVGLNTELEDWRDKFEHNYKQLNRVAQQLGMSFNKYELDFDATEVKYHEFISELWRLKQNNKNHLCDISQKEFNRTDNEQPEIKNDPPVPMRLPRSESSHFLSKRRKHSYLLSPSTSTQLLKRKTFTNSKATEAPKQKKHKSGT